MKDPLVLESHKASQEELSSSFFSLLEAHFDSTSSNMKIIFGVLDELASKPLKLLPESYLKGAVGLLNHLKEGFAKSRSLEVIKWLIHEFSANCLSFEVVHYNVKVKKHLVQYPFQERETCSVLMNIKVSAFDKNILKGLIKSKSQLYLVEGTFFSQLDHQNEMLKVHFELQKNEGLLNHADLLFIEKELPKLIFEEIGVKDRLWIVPSNRELLLKNFDWIVKEMQPGDIPQVFIDFSKQTSLALHFSTLICSLAFHEKNLLKSKLSHGDLQIEGSTVIKDGKILKEGIVASIEVPFYANLSPIDARKKCAQLIEGLIGPFRDINGGLLEKIEKNLVDFAAESGEEISTLKPFFYSITPQELQATAPISLLVHAYTSLKAAKENKEQSDLLFYEDKEILSICIKVGDGSFLKGFKKMINKQAARPVFSSFETKIATLTCCSLTVSDFYQAQEIKKQVSFYYRHWLGRKEQKQVLRIPSNTSFTSFDPRIGTDEETSFLHRILFAGLMQINEQGVVETAIAKEVQVFNQGKHYRFKLRRSYWSDGSLLTTKDFVYSWKTSLNPKFFSPLSHFFYPIRNSQKIKEGKLSPDHLGVEAPDSLTLDVFLEFPCHYFLELCAHPVFSPILMRLDQENPNWAEHTGNDYTCNGGFLLEKVTKDLVLLKKNPRYWNASQVFLEKIEISYLSEEKSLELFQKQQVDALLSPLSRGDLSGIAAETASKKWKEEIETKYLCFNCQVPLFANQKIRKAISLVVNRRNLAESYSPNSFPHFVPYSPHFSQIEPIKVLDVEQAKVLLKEGLKEVSLPLEFANSMKLSVSLKNKRLAEALVEQINQALNFKWKVATFSTKDMARIISQEKAEMTLYGWQDKISNPSYFLEIFSSSSNPINLSLWSCVRIRFLIHQIRSAKSPEKRRKLHKEAEKVLHRHLPVVPLLVTPSYSVTQPYVSTFLQQDKLNLLRAYKR